MEVIKLFNCLACFTYLLVCFGGLFLVDHRLLYKVIG